MILAGSNDSGATLQYFELEPRDVNILREIPAVNEFPGAVKLREVLPESTTF